MRYKLKVNNKDTIETLREKHYNTRLSVVFISPDVSKTIVNQVHFLFHNALIYTILLPMLQKNISNRDAWCGSYNSNWKLNYCKISIDIYESFCLKPLLMS